jgi:hypothetical protein
VPLVLVGTAASDAVVPPLATPLDGTGLVAAPKSLPVGKGLPLLLPGDGILVVVVAELAVEAKSCADV